MLPLVLAVGQTDGVILINGVESPSSSDMLSNVTNKFNTVMRTKVVAMAV